MKNDGELDNNAAAQFISYIPNYLIALHSFLLLCCRTAGVVPSFLSFNFLKGECPGREQLE